MPGSANPDCEPESTSSGQPFTGRRGAARLRLSLPARLQTMYDIRRCVLLDLSRTGAQLGVEKPLRNGESAILELAVPDFRDIDQFGAVVRQSENDTSKLIGLKFETPLREADILAVRRLHDNYAADRRQSLRAEVRAWVSGAG